ncbi:MAG: hypothetical protein GY765_39465, partial [bacterium]|nr:hypothetical protein [bacterium]
RHEALRTGLIYVHHNTFQYVADTVELPFQFHDLSADEEKESGADEIYRILATTVFPMDKLPLFRAVLVKLDNNHYEFMFNMHHIISDGWSVGVLRNDFLQIYNYLESLTEHRESPPLLNTMGEAPDYPSLPGPGPADFTYIDFTLWHNRRISHTAHGTETNPALELWKQKMAGGIPDLSLPADYSKNAESATGAKFCSLLPRELKDTLNTTAGQRRTSLFTLLFAAYIMMLMRVSNQEDIGCSVIVAGRDHEELQHIVGLFVNSILLKIHVDRDESFDAFLERVNKEVMDCFQYQDYPLELVFRALNIRYPEISVSFNMLSILDTAGSALPAHYETGYMGEVQDVKFDLEPY